MEGIFFAYSVLFEDIIKRYVNASSALSEEQVSPSIENAVRIFLTPLLSQEVMDHLVKVAKGHDVSEVENMALEEARCAAVNLALFFDFDELNVHLTDQGWKREEGDTYKSLYHYQEINLKEAYRNKGYNAIDRLIRLLSASLHVFPEFEHSPAYMDSDRSLVRGAKEIDRYFAINESPLVYLALKPNIRLVVDNELEPLVGTRCVDLLKGYLQDRARSDREDAFTMEVLRKYVASYVICLALARQVEVVGSLTDRGMYFDSVSAGLRNSVKSAPLPDAERKRIAEMMRRDATRYQGRLLSFIERELPDYFCGRPGEAYRRDNECKRTFWA